jgi:hypothetical protein
MFLYKSSGATYGKVVKQSVHAFPYSPAEARQDEFVLLSKNRADCRNLEKQVQWVAKVLDVRSATATELENLFPRVGAGSRWNHVVKLYWVKALTKPFNLSAIPGFNAKRYDTVREFAKLDDQDEQALFRYLVATNSDVVLDFVNNAERP